ncbi:MAG: hypothetical protein ACRDKJ_00970, partial [Actinomycetota bacterium]
MNLEFRVDDQFGIERVELRILSEEDGIPSPKNGAPIVEPWTFERGSAPTSQTLRYNWDTNTLTPRNGRYKVQVIAYSYGPDHAPQASSPECRQDYWVAERCDLRVDNQPKTPAAPRIIAKTGTTVSVEWDKAPEPDVLSYQLYRTKTSSPEK